MFDLEFVLNVVNYNVVSCHSLVIGSDAGEANHLIKNGCFQYDGWSVHSHVMVGGSLGIRVIKTVDDKVAYRRCHAISSGTIMLGHIGKRPKVTVYPMLGLDAVKQYGVHQVSIANPNTTYEKLWQVDSALEQDYTVLVSDGTVDISFPTCDPEMIYYAVRDAKWAILVHYEHRDEKDIARTVTLVTSEDPVVLQPALEAYLEGHCMTDFSDALDLWPDIMEIATS